MNIRQNIANLKQALFELFGAGRDGREIVLEETALCSPSQADQTEDQ